MAGMPIPRDWLPHLRQNPWRVPSEQDQSGHGYWVPAYNPTNGTRAPASAPVGKAWTKVNPTIRIAPYAAPKAQLAQHTFSRAGLRVKERKIAMKARFILSAINYVTETNDILDSLWKSLPKQYQRLPEHRGLRAMRPQHKLKSLYRHWDKVEFEKFVREVVKNEIEDRIYGGIGKGLKKLNQTLGSVKGVQLGEGAPGKLPDWIRRDGDPVKTFLDWLL